MALGTVYLNDADIQSTYFLKVSELSGWPGILSSASRTVPVIEGPEMQAVLVDPRMIRRKSGTATIKGTIETASVSAGMAALDALREVVMQGDVRVRTAYASDRECVSVLTDFTGDPEAAGVINGRMLVAMTFLVRDGAARRLAPDCYALTTGRTACPIGTAESRPIIIVHGGGASLTNPVITTRNAQGDPVQSMSFTVVIGATAYLRVDSTRMRASLVTAGVPADALLANYWPVSTGGDFPVLRLCDAFPSLGAFATVELSASAGVAQGEINYRRRYA